LVLKKGPKIYVGKKTASSIKGVEKMDIHERTRSSHCIKINSQWIKDLK
jgi:hypothetical protein